MKSIVILGAGGFARELMWLIESIGNWKILGFIRSESQGEITELHGYRNYPTIGFFTKDYPNYADIYFCLGAGSPKVKESMDYEARAYGLVPCPALVHPDVKLHPSIQLSENVVLCEGASLTVDITIGYGTMLNLHCTVGHDTKIGDFCTFSPGVHLSGNVVVENNVECGTNSSVLPYCTLGVGCVLGAGAVAVKSIPAGVVAVGIPAKQKG
ncbi:MAG: NeuD/PglB/VioB family sugar acetyltransferase [Ignavibacteria bacterium]|nr:NeuD/PglB/VioB family sugar acetyltransferase [Ignavibacteria bacterium]